MTRKMMPDPCLTAGPRRGRRGGCGRQHADPGGCGPGRPGSISLSGRAGELTHGMPWCASLALAPPHAYLPSPHLSPHARSLAPLPCHPLQLPAAGCSGRRRLISEGAARVFGTAVTVGTTGLSRGRLGLRYVGGGVSAVPGPSRGSPAAAVVRTGRPSVPESVLSSLRVSDSDVSLPSDASGTSKGSEAASSLPHVSSHYFLLAIFTRRIRAARGPSCFGHGVPRTPLPALSVLSSDGLKVKELSRGTFSPVLRGLFFACSMPHANVERNFKGSILCCIGAAGEERTNSLRHTARALKGFADFGVYLSDSRICQIPGYFLWSLLHCRAG